MNGSLRIDGFSREAAIVLEVIRDAAVGVAGLAALAALVAVLVSAGYRWSTTRPRPAGAATVLGLASVAGYLSYDLGRTGTVVDGLAPDAPASATVLLVTFLLAGLVSHAGGQLADRVTCQVTGLSRIDASGEAASAIESAALAVDIALPETIEDAAGYRPTDARVRRALAGSTIRLPHGLPSTVRRRRIERHVERAYDVDCATVSMGRHGTVDRLIVGRRPPGLGSSLPPETVAVAIRTDGVPDAASGDRIEIWSPDGASRLVATGRLRTTNGSVATVVVDADHADDLDGEKRYRLLVRPGEPTDGHAFEALLGPADVTVVSGTIPADGSLVGEFVGWLPGRVLVIDREGELLALPADNETLRAGDQLWLLATPEALSRFDSTNGTSNSPTTTEFSGIFTPPEDSKTGETTEEATA